MLILFNVTILNSLQPETWIAFFALVVSVVSIFVSIRSLKIQRDHNKKSVLPIGNINLANYDDEITIKVSNKGIGPLIVKSFKTQNEHEVKSYPIDWMPQEYCFDTYRKNLEGHAIAPGCDLILLYKKVDVNNDKAISELNQIKGVLRSLTLEFEYKDIYGKEDSVKRNLNWFTEYD